MMHMCELALAPDALYAFGRERGLSMRDMASDPDYVVHAWLAEVLGEKVLRPFRVMQRSPVLRVLGYSEFDGGELDGRIAFNAMPSVAAVLQGSVRSKPMPHEFEAGQSFAFELQMLCTRSFRTEDGKKHERDAFVAASSKNPGITPAQAYCELLALRLGEGAQLTGCEVAGIESRSMVRKHGSPGARRTRVMNFPVATLRGTLRVASPKGFAELLQGGVGRGSGLGLGMLMLRKA